MLIRKSRKKLSFARVLLVLAAFLSSTSIAAARAPSGVELSETASGLEAQWNKDAVRRAAVLYLAAGETFRKEGDLEHAAQSLRRAARLQNIAGDRSGALRTLAAAVRLNPRLSALGAVKTLSLYCGFLTESDNAAKAALLVDEARRLAESSRDPVARAYALRASGDLKEYRAEFAEAEADYLEAAAVFRQNPDEEDRLARTLLLVAGVRMPLGKTSEGLADANEAVEIFARAGATRDLALARILKGHFLALLDRKQEALEEYRAAEAVFPADIDLAKRAMLVAGIGYVYEDMGDLRLSFAKRREAYDLYVRADYRAAINVSLPVLMDLSFRLGDVEAAFDYLRQCEILTKQTDFRLALATAHTYVADHYLAQKDYGRALDFYKKAMPVMEASRVVYGEAMVHDKLGSVYLLQGKNNEARRELESSLALAGQIRNARLEANSLFNLARLEFSEGHTLEALRLSGASIEKIEKLSASVNNARLRTSHFASVYDQYEVYIRLLMHAFEETGDQEYALRALQASERGRTRTMLENMALAGADLTADAPPELLQKEKDLRGSLHAASERLAGLLDTNTDIDAIRSLEDEIDSIEQDLEDLRSEFKQNSPIYSAIKDPPQFDIGAFQSSVLDERSALIEFSLGAEESYMWVVDRGRVNSFKLPSREELASRVSAVKQALLARGEELSEPVEVLQERIGRADEIYRREAGELAAILLGPAASVIDGKRLLIVADGPLHELSFAALPAVAGSEGTLLDTNEFVYLPSAQTLTFLASKPAKPSSPNARELVLFSDPVFSADDERLTGVESESAHSRFRFVESLSSLSRLRGSGREAEAVAAAVGRSGSDQFSGFSATREAFLSVDLERYKILHLATHAIANGERPETSGIIFSGFGPRGEKLDQLVRLQDIYSLRLNADLVVLSACGTATGKELRGEGLVSLNNAFIQAGSRSVLSTLWKVDDEATQVFMTGFYDELLGGKTPSAALRLAQERLRAEPRFASPFYWAAFTLHGDPNVKIDLSHRRPGWFFALLGIAVLVPGAFFAMKYRRKGRAGR